MKIRSRPALSRRGALIGLAMSAVPLFAACSPTVQVVAPKDPITINLNIKLDADVKLRLEEQAKQDVGTKPIF